jgi:hypothetical protein
MTMKDILLYVWQLPQNLLGLLLLAIVRPEDIYDYEGEKLCYSYKRMRGGISLGKYIIVRSVFRGMNDQTEKHELGHAIQSRMLGPLYLIVIGLPSLLWAAWWNEGRNRSYYSFYTERWADYLGGVNRDE